MILQFTSVCSSFLWCGLSLSLSLSLHLCLHHVPYLNPFNP